MDSHELRGAISVLWFATICFGLPVLLAGLADAVEAIVKRKKERREALRTRTEF